MFKTLLLVLVFICFAEAQTLNAKIISVEVDGGTFRIDKDNVKWELYYSFPDTSLKYIYKDGKYIGEMYFSVSILSSIKTVAQKQWIVSYQNDSISAGYKMNLLGEKSFVIPNGQYKVEVTLYDVNDTTTKATTKFDLITREFSQKRLQISDLQLAQKIEHENNTTQQWNDSFRKNSLIVVPDPTLEFIGDNPFINVYLEIYNAKTASPDGFSLVYTIYDNLKKEIYTYTKNRKSDDDGLVEFISIPADFLNSGVYYLSVKTLSSLQNPVDSSISFKKFYIINPAKPPDKTVMFTENQSFERSEFATMTPDQVKDEISKVKFIANPAETDLLSDLQTVDAKKRFLFRFWKQRDTDSTDGINEALDKFRERERFANTYFKYGKMKDGWRTERGRVYLKYGKPTTRDTYPPAMEERAYEKWQYDDVQGGVYFYFVDMLGFGNFILVNSNAMGEIRNDNWYNEYVVPHNNNANQDLIK
jgi:GWxTD domain-containing protein